MLSTIFIVGMSAGAAFLVLQNIHPEKEEAVQPNIIEFTPNEDRDLVRIARLEFAVANSQSKEAKRIWMNHLLALKRNIRWETIR